MRPASWTFSCYSTTVVAINAPWAACSPLDSHVIGIPWLVRDSWKIRLGTVSFLWLLMPLWSLIRDSPISDWDLWWLPLGGCMNSFQSPIIKNFWWRIQRELFWLDTSSKLGVQIWIWIQIHATFFNGHHKLIFGLWTFRCHLQLGHIHPVSQCILGALNSWHQVWIHLDSDLFLHVSLLSFSAIYSTGYSTCWNRWSCYQNFLGRQHLTTFSAHLLWWAPSIVYDHHIFSTCNYSQ